MSVEADRDRVAAYDTSRWHAQTVFDGCVRACMTSVLGLPLVAAEHVDSEESDWWTRWLDFVEGYGFELLLIYPKRMSAPPQGYWLAVVPSLVLNGNHCIVAKGNDLVHDPGMTRRYTAAEWSALWEGKREIEGWLLVPLDPAESVAAKRERDELVAYWDRAEA